MTNRKILLINGHPDPSSSRLAGALANAYQQGAERAGHQVRRIELGALSFPPIITGAELEEPPPEAIAKAQDDIRWCDHLVLVFPLWLSAPPALVKSFFEQICRYDFAFDHAAKPLLKGRSARLIVPMIIPTLVFHLLFGGGVKGFARGVLWASGFKPIRTLPLGKVLSADKKPWLEQVEALGARAG